VTVYFNYFNETIFMWIAAAEVNVHGCCSSLNATAPHHLGLTGSKPPDIITAMTYRARIFSQTLQNGAVSIFK
jgi:hypothetical protein